MKIRAVIQLSLGSNHKIVIDEDGEIISMISVDGDELADKIVSEVNSGRLSSGKEAIEWAKKEVFIKEALEEFDFPRETEYVCVRASKEIDENSEEHKLYQSGCFCAYGKDFTIYFPTIKMAISK